ncbi:MAG: response regulator [Nitrospirae bacterium]|nr:response regulator [Nitrospirota bacterium]MBF0536285.1 response regulator [Nitrospirota bacterium]MBF0618225.1 response regulator [Nitrospirota bacterium]
MRILIVDDDPDIRTLLSFQLKKLGHSVLTAADGYSALNKILQFIPDIVLLDIEMPGINGIETLKRIRTFDALKNTPVIMISAHSEQNYIIDTIKSGASDYILKPFNIGLLLGKINTWINSMLKDNWKNLEPQKTQALNVGMYFVELSSKHIENGKPLSYNEAHIASKLLIDAVKEYGNLFVFDIFAENEDTLFVHSLKSASLFYIFANKMGFNEEFCFNMTMGGLLYDIGTALVPFDLTFKPDKLEGEELMAVRRHVTQGVEFLQKEPQMPSVVLDMCRGHHERPDGSGYPYGLMDADVTTPMRMAAIVDTYSALTSKKVYRRAYTSNEAFNIILDSEREFDRDLVRNFLTPVAFDKTKKSPHFYI